MSGRPPAKLSGAAKVVVTFVAATLFRIQLPTQSTVIGALLGGVFRDQLNGARSQPDLRPGKVVETHPAWTNATLHELRETHSDVAGHDNPAPVAADDPVVRRAGRAEVVQYAVLHNALIEFVSAARTGGGRTGSRVRLPDTTHQWCSK